jgi:subtilisin family serine protease
MGKITDILFYCLIIAASFCPMARCVMGGEIVKVAVIDTGLDLQDTRFAKVLCPTGHQDFTGSGIQDTVGHGTHVAGLIMQYAARANYCLVIYKFYQNSSTPNSVTLLAAINEAVKEKVKYINISGGGTGFRELEYNAIKKAKDITFIAAAGNEKSKDMNWYPAAYDLPNVIAVGALDKQGDHWYKSNSGPYVKVWEPGELIYSTLPYGEYGYDSGTSMSTAIYTGKLIWRNR